MRYFRYCIIVLIMISCAKTEEARIPYYPVNLKLYLNFEDKELLSSGNSKIYTAKDITASEKAGFGGVIVYHSPYAYGEYWAYDLACPYEASTSSLIEVKEQGNLYAVCPHCKSEYDLTLGYPKQGSVSTYRLQPYNVYHQTASELVVLN